MAVGDLLVADWQWEIRGLLGGAATPYNNGEPGWSGLGLPPVKTSDLTLDQADGDVLGRDHLASRILTFPIVWGGTGAADVFLGLSELLEAWEVSTAVDLELAFKVPGWGRCRVTGRPRGLVEDLARAPKGEGAALATFVAGDPAIVFLDGP